MSPPPREPPILAASRVIRLLATESSAAIMEVLSDGPLRSNDLKGRLAQYSPRTVYRRVDELVQLGAVEQRSFPISPPRVDYGLTAKAGRELLGVLEGFAVPWLSRCHDVPVVGRRWGLLGLLADGWDSGIVRELSSQPRSLSELGLLSEMTYHQLERRVTRLTAAGLLERRRGDRATQYTLSAQTRWGATVIAAAVSWERRNLPPARPISAEEAVALLRAFLPLARLPGQAGAVFVATVEAPRGAESSQRFGSLRVAIEADGAVRCSENGNDPPDAWARGSIDAWLSALVEADSGSLQVGGDRSIVDSHLSRLYGETASMTWSTK